MEASRLSDGVSLEGYVVMKIVLCFDLVVRGCEDEKLALPLEARIHRAISSLSTLQSCTYLGARRRSMYLLIFGDKNDIEILKPRCKFNEAC